MKAVRVGPAERAFLSSAEFLPEDLRQIIASQLGSGDAGHEQLDLEEGVAERVRDAFTHQLARAGFDDEYGLTTEGEMLERLIDGFAT